MEFVDGKTLESMEGGLPIGELLHLLEQTAEGLDYAHSKGIVHRDIKPGNIMIAAGQAKITDFGVARFRHKDSTQAGSLMGTPSYMSPEQVSGAETTGASDQYSLAVIAYQFLCGRKPFESPSLATLLYRITQEEPPPAPNLSPTANRVLLKALGKHPQLRYLSCVEFVLALEEALGESRSNGETKSPAGGRRTPVRELSGDEPTIAQLDPPPPVAAQVELPPPPRREPPQAATKRSQWLPIAGVLFGAVLLVGALWFSFGRGGGVPDPSAGNGSAASNPTSEGTNKPSPMGAAIPPPAPAPVEVPPVSSAPADTPRDETKPVQNPAASTSTHVVNFNSIPDGAEIFIESGEGDSKLKDRCAKAPCVMELPGGAYRVEARLPGFDAVSRTVRVPETSRVVLAFEKAEPTLAVNSTPPGASLRLDGRSLAEKTPALLNLPAGKYTLEIIKDGFPTQSKEVVIRSGVLQTLSVNWN
jgi:serine/threonine protein kinase